MCVDVIIYNLEKLYKYVLVNSPEYVALTEAIEILKKENEGDNL